MSKIREQFTDLDPEATGPEEGDLAAYVVFTQLREGQPMRYAGWLDASDDRMAMYFAREHYGRDQEITWIWAIPRDAVTGTDLFHECDNGRGEERAFRVFTQAKPGDIYLSGDTVTAASLKAALVEAQALVRDVEPSAVWVADAGRIIEPTEDDLLWRLTDQTYRLARGYTSGVREKWDLVRDPEALARYRASDLTQEF